MFCTEWRPEDYHLLPIFRRLLSIIDEIPTSRPPSYHPNSQKQRPDWYLPRMREGRWQLNLSASLICVPSTISRQLTIPVLLQEGWTLYWRLWLLYGSKKDLILRIWTKQLTSSRRDWNTKCRILRSSGRFYVKGKRRDLITELLLSHMKTSISMLLYIRNEMYASVSRAWLLLVAIRSIVNVSEFVLMLGI